MRRYLHIVGIILFTISGLNSKENKNVLLLYDKLNDKSEISILYLKERLISDGIVVKGVEIKEANQSKLSIEEFSYIIIYSEVRAFHMRHQLKRWIDNVEEFENKKIALFITSITEKYGKKVTLNIKKEIKNRDGIIIDAFSSATGKLSDETKKRRVETFSKSFLDFISEK